jgi:hypothetical protein
MSPERFELLSTIYVLCMNWHSGQWSRGYRILSRLSERGMRLSDGYIQEIIESPLYDVLVLNYGDKL